MKVQISIDDKLMERIDNFAEKNYLSRSGFMSLASVQYLNNAEVVMLIRDMSLAMRKIADNNIVDEETMEKLKDFEQLSKMLTGELK